MFASNRITWAFPVGSWRRAIGAVLSALLLTGAHAQIVVTENPTANAMGAQLFECGGFTFVSATLAAYGKQVGTYTVGSNPNGYGMTRNGVILSTGYATMGATGPNSQAGTSNLAWVSANAAQNAMLTAVSGNSTYYNCAQLTVTFNNPSSTSSPLAFDLTFGSEEYPEYVGSTYIDGFGIFLNGTAVANNIAYVASKPINVSHPDMGVRVETELDGVLINKTNNTAVCTVTGTANPGLNTLIFIIADRGDPYYDSLAYISSIRPTCPPIGFTKQPVSVPASDGQTVVLSTVAVGNGPLKYQWFRSCNGKGWSPITGGAGVSGWNTPTLTVGPMGLGVGCNCQYYCEVTDGCCNKKQTNTASIFWPTPMSITKHPTNVSVSPGASASFTVAATGSQPITYQWYKICQPKTGAYQTVVDGGRFSGAKTPTLTINPVSTADCLCSFYCEISGPCGYQNTKSAVLSCGCTSPPSNMVLWLPLDETSGTVAANLTGPNNGTYVGFIPYGGSGKVNHGLCMDGTGGVDVAAYTSINVGTGDFSIDAWILPQGLPATQMIVDKRAFSVSYAPFRGYALYLNSAGVLSLDLSDGVGPPSTYSGGPAIPGTWTHVAATIKRNSATGVTLYVNGVSVPVSSPSTVAQNLTIGTSQLLRVGARSSAPITSHIEQFWGCIDEVEIFSRVLTVDEVKRVALADYLGKCRPIVNPWGTFATCTAVDFITAQITITNPSSDPTVGTIELQPDLGCSASSPTSFTTDPPSPVLLNPGETKHIMITMPRPADAIDGAVSCFQVCVNGRDGSAVCATDQLIFRTDFCVTGADHPPAADGFAPFDVGPATLKNNTAGPRAMDMRVTVIDDLGQPDTRVIGLNGLPPGEPYLFTPSVPAGGQVAIPLLGRFAEADPLHYYNILIEADTDGDGEFEPLRSIPVHQSFTPACPTELDDTFDSDPLGSACGVSGWQPWLNGSSGCGTITAEQARGAGNSMKIAGSPPNPSGKADDAVYVTDLASGAWTITAHILVPTSSHGRAFVNLLNTYPLNLNWSTDIAIDADTGLVQDIGNPGGTPVPLVRNQWVELRIDVDLDGDTVSAFYDNQQFIFSRSWSNGDSGNGQKRLQALDIYSGEPVGITTMYVDDVSIRAVCSPGNACPADFNADGAVDDADFIFFVQSYDVLDCADPAMPAGCPADLNHDGQVNDTDFTIFLAAYNTLICP